MNPVRLRVCVYIAISIILSGIGDKALAAGMKIGVAGNVVGKVTVTSLSGSARDLVVGGPVHLNETIISGDASKAQIMFLDKSALMIQENTTIVVDKFVFNPGTTGGDMSISGAKGALRFIGGALSKTKPVTIKTPVATIGIRGGIADTHIGHGGATDAIFVYGEEMTMANANGQTQRITTPGEGLTMLDATSIPAPLPPARVMQHLNTFTGDASNTGADKKAGPAPTEGGKTKGPHGKPKQGRPPQHHDGGPDGPHDDGPHDDGGPKGPDAPDADGEHHDGGPKSKHHKSPRGPGKMMTGGPRHHKGPHQGPHHGPNHQPNQGPHHGPHHADGPHPPLHFDPNAPMAEGEFGGPEGGFIGHPEGEFVGGPDGEFFGDPTGDFQTHTITDSTTNDDPVAGQGPINGINAQCTNCNFVDWGQFGDPPIPNVTKAFVAANVPIHVAGQATQNMQSTVVPQSLGSVNYAGIMIGAVEQHGNHTGHTGSFNAVVNLNHRKLTDFDGNFAGNNFGFSGQAHSINGNGLATFHNIPVHNLGTGASSDISGTINGALFGANAEDIGGNFAIQNAATNADATGIYLGTR